MRTALWDAFLAETPSITVMEVTAIGVSLWLAQGAGMGEAAFWSSLIVSLSAGLIVAYPVNVLLIRWGVKEGQLSLASKMINSQVMNRLVREYIDDERDAAATVAKLNEELAKIQ